MKNENKKVQLIVGIILPIASGIISYFLSLAKLDPAQIEPYILSSVVGILVAEIERAFAHYQEQKENEELHEELLANMEKLRVLSSVQEKMEAIKHPYFQKIAEQRLRKFITDNNMFFSGTYKTNPNAEDTFGIAGIECTEENGTILAVSSIDDYWEDSFTKRYLKIQEELIKNHGVKIQRIFLVDRKNPRLENIKKAMKQQSEMGVKVMYLYKDSHDLDEQYRKEDFLIQDGKLLVSVAASSHNADALPNDCETITLDSGMIQSKEAIFRLLASKAIPGVIV